MNATFRFVPSDTLMFREGFPFNQGDEGAAAAQSVFPPYPPTIVGAIRLALAQAAGYPKVVWPEHLLGSGTDWQSDVNPLEPLLHPLSFGPIYLETSDAPDERQALFPAPLSVARGTVGETELFTLLSPGRDSLETDLGPVPLPCAPDEVLGLKPLDSHFLTAQGLRQVIKGAAPDPKDVFESKDLWSHETRVGIAVDPASRHVIDGALYTAGHARLRDGVSICVDVAGLPEGHSLKDASQVLGGEHRTAFLSGAFGPRWSESLQPEPPSRTTDDRCAVIALSPVFLSSPPLPGSSFSGLPGPLVSACLGKPVWIGGWNSARRRPIAMRQAYPAGSVFFLKETSEALPLGTPCEVGSFTHWGFGQAVVANWGEKT